MITQPMLAGTINGDEDLAKLNFPVLVTPKIDGVRTLHLNRGAMSRKFLPVPNIFMRIMIENEVPQNTDGEIVVPGQDFTATSRAWRKQEGAPLFNYLLFDYVPGGAVETPYEARMEALQHLHLPSFCSVLTPKRVTSLEELLTYEAEMLAQGYEGVMVRAPQGPYKCGRSTVKEGWLLKLKRFEDANARILGAEEQMHNLNESEDDAFGRAKRSSAAANLVGAGVLGALRVVGLEGTYKDVEFKIGTGFDAADRVALWGARDTLPGQVVKFKFQRVGADEKPRFPTWLGFRASEDL